MKTKLAILGIGRWGKHYVRHFIHHPQAEIVALVDPNPSELTYMRQQYNLSDSVALALDWEEIRKLKQIEAVVVATPTSTHYNLIQDALNLGYHVLAEKPLSLDPSECRTLTQLARQKNLTLFTDHIYLFHSAIQKGKELIQSRHIGELRYGYATRTHIEPVRSDIDVLWDLAIHDIAIFNEWVGETPHQVCARGKVWLQKETVNPVAPHSQGLADLMWVSLFYPSGFEATIHLSWLNPDKQRRLCVVGSEGTLIFDELSYHTPLSVQKGTLKPYRKGFVPHDLNFYGIGFEYREPLQQVCDRFLSCVENQTDDPATSPQKAAELVNILYHLTKSYEKQGEVLSITP